MLVVTAGSSNYPYRKTIRYCKKQCNKFGYDIRIYDLGDLGFGIPFNDPGETREWRHAVYCMKPDIILDALKNTGSELVVWIDGDATLIDSLDELEADLSFDIGVTIRPKVNKKRTPYVNAGIFFVRNNEAGKGFVEHWRSRISELNKIVTSKTYCDQLVLEEDILLPNVDVVPWDAFNSIHMIQGARVKLFEGAIYNNWWAHAKETWGPPNGSKILHFKGRNIDRLEAYSKEFL